MPELKSTVKSKPNARVSLPGNRRIEKRGNIQFLPFPLSLSHLAQFRSAGFLLRIWASTDGSKPFCLFNNCETMCERTEAVSGVLFQCTVRPVNGALGVHAQRKEKHAASKEELKHGSEKSYSIRQQRVTCVPPPVSQGSVQSKGRSVRRENEVQSYSQHVFGWIHMI